MIKKRKVKDNPEYQYFEENYDKIMEDLDNDPELQNLEIPDEWDKNFRKTIEETIEREAQKQNVRDKRFKWIGRGVAAAAGIALVMFIGMNMSAVQVQGEGLLDVFRNTFDLNGKKYTSVDVGEDVEVSMEEEGIDMYFDVNTLDEAYQQIREEFKIPMFYITYIPEGYELTETKYNRTFKLLNFELRKNQNTIYILQQQQFEEVVTGVVNEDNKCAEINNSNIGQIITIYESAQDQSFAFNINVDQSFLSVNCKVSLEDAKKIAESLEFY